jgi:hypothetical protein
MANFILMHVSTQFIQHHLLKTVPFLKCMLETLSKINLSYMHTIISGFSILSHCVRVQFSQDHALLITITL